MATKKSQKPAVKQNSTSVMSKLKLVTAQAAYPWILLIGGAIGLIAAVILTVEKIHLLQNPGASLGCDLNPIIACGSVINTDQASAFGFPNPLIGIAGFFGLMVIGAAILAGARLKRWFWLGLQAGTVFGISFATWLQFQSIANIGALCPFCMVVWSMMIPIFIYTTVYNIREGHIVGTGVYAKVCQFISRNHVDILITWFLLIIATITVKFWYYWSTLI